MHIDARSQAVRFTRESAALPTHVGLVTCRADGGSARGSNDGSVDVSQEKSDEGAAKT